MKLHGAALKGSLLLAVEISFLAGCGTTLVVTDDVTCEPIAGAHVHYETELVTLDLTTDEDGEVSLPDDEVGTVRIEKPGYVPDAVAWPAWTLDRALVPLDAPGAKSEAVTLIPIDMKEPKVMEEPENPEPTPSGSGEAEPEGGESPRSTAPAQTPEAEGESEEGAGAER